MRIGIDLGAKTGLAWTRECSEHDYTCLNLVKPKDDKSQRFITLKHELDIRFGALRPDIVYYEDVKRHAGTLAAHAYGGYLAVLRMTCQEKGVKLVPIGVGTVKKHATGKGNASKQMMLEAAKKYFGYEGKNDNIADALWILQTGLDKERF